MSPEKEQCSYFSAVGNFPVSLDSIPNGVLTILPQAKSTKTREVLYGVSKFTEIYLEV